MGYGALWEPSPAGSVHEVMVTETAMAMAMAMTMIRLMMMVMMMMMYDDEGMMMMTMMMSTVKLSGRRPPNFRPVVVVCRRFRW